MKPASKAWELAESWVNGNRNDVWREIIALPSPEAVGLAMAISEKIRGWEGAKAALDFNLAMRDRAKGE